MPSGKLKFLPILVITLLSGCVTTQSNKKAYDDLALKSPCCSDLSTIPTRLLIIGQSLSFDISESSPVFEFPQHKSYFEAFELPEIESKYTLSLRSIYAYAPTTSTQPIFQPTLLFLDAKKAVIGKIGQERFRYAPNGMFEGAGLELNIVFSNKEKSPRYVVVYSELASPDAGRPLPVPQSGGAYMVGNVVVPTYSGGGTAMSEPTPTGSLRIALKP